MTAEHPLHDPRLIDAWTDARANTDDVEPFEPHTPRLAFNDTEFMMRREVRGIRLQLELLKPDLAQESAGIKHTVVVFGSARFRSQEEADAALVQARLSQDAASIRKAERLVSNAHYYESARRFAQLVCSYNQRCDQPEHHLHICTGGGPGIMEAANRGAYEVGSPSVGLNIALPHEQFPNPYITPELSFKFHYFAIRKLHFMMRAKALVAFPGGFGTLDELFEIITLVQCKKSKPTPIVLFGKDYWQRLINFEMLLDEGVISEDDLNLFEFVDTPEDAWRAIQRFYVLGGDADAGCTIF
ncbi:MAG: hypothetical protein RL357_1624 [Pseudomonadota bacterium]